MSQTLFATHLPDHTARVQLPLCIGRTRLADERSLCIVPCSKNWNALKNYQACEHANADYKSKLEPFKKSLPSGVLRDYKC
jgi:hypothetical protein